MDEAPQEAPQEPLPLQTGGKERLCTGLSSGSPEGYQGGTELSGSPELGGLGGVKGLYLALDL